MGVAGGIAEAAAERFFVMTVANPKRTFCATKTMRFANGLFPKRRKSGVVKMLVKALKMVQEENR